MSYKVGDYVYYLDDEFEGYGIIEGFSRINNFYVKTLEALNEETVKYVGEVNFTTFEDILLVTDEKTLQKLNKLVTFQ